jgi:hypothetical protein
MAMELFLQKKLNSNGKLEASSLAVLALHWQNDLVLPDGKFGFFAKEIERNGLVPRMATSMIVLRTQIAV